MKIENNASLLAFNTFGIDAKCKKLTIIETDDEIQILFDNGLFEEPFMIIGGGSNLLFTQDYPGNIIQLQNKGIDRVNEDDDSVYLRVAAGETWEDFIHYCIEKELYGAENLIGIPGWVGSSPVQNIGAYGVEAKDIIHQVEGYFIQGQKPFLLYRDECAFEYRNSIFKKELKNQTLITHVVFKLSKKAHFNLSYPALEKEILQEKQDLTLTRISDIILSIRNSKLPDIKTVGCAGSFFKNPVISKEKFEQLINAFPYLTHYQLDHEQIKLAAGQLIELCDWKGVREGDAGVYPKQALVIVNYGNATGKEIVALYNKVQQSVKVKFDLDIEPEVIVI